MLEEVDLRQLRQQAGDLAPAFLRLDAYQGVAREIGWMLFNLALWPLGLVDEAVRAGASKVSNGSSHSKSRPRPTPDAAEVPILLIHGYFHNRSGLMVMRRALRRQGFASVYAFSYNPLRKGIPEMAEAVKRRVEAIIEQTGARKVHLIGHSLGGMLARYYVEQMEGHSKVHTLVTLGTPHHGTMIAFAGRSPAARQLRPGSDLIASLLDARKPRSVRYISYYSNLDALVVPARSAILNDGDGSSVRNILVRDLGHMSLLISAELIASIAVNLSDLNGGANGP